MADSKNRTLIVCDAQPDVVKKLPQPRLFCDLLHLVVEAARQHGGTRILHTQLRFDDGYESVPPSHPKLGVLAKMSRLRPGSIDWFTSSDLCVGAPTTNTANDDERILTRTSYLPHATDPEWKEVFGGGKGILPDHRVTLVGYGPTVQAVCHLLGDVLAVPTVEILRDCCADERPERLGAFLNHGLLFKETVVSAVDYLDALDLLHQEIVGEHPSVLPASSPPPVKYVCDAGRGGHLSLFLPYLTKNYGYVEWPTQPWYQDGYLGTKQYHCPLGRCRVPLCDEPKFGSGTRFFLRGRQFLDEKDLLHELVPELMPPTFHSLEEAREYLSAEEASAGNGSAAMLWFLKKVNQNGGRAVDVLKALPEAPLAEDEQLQAHVPRPLLWEGGLKCHVKTYFYLSTTCSPDGKIEWNLYLHDLFYLATAPRPWTIEDPSDDCQITTLRTHRLPADHPWRSEWNLERCETHLTTIVTRAIEQGKLKVPETPETPNKENNPATRTATKTLQFEVNSADWMLDEDGKMYLIECNGIPVLYDGGREPSQPLCTRGLELYDKLYKENPSTAVVNDHDLLRDTVTLAMTGSPPSGSLWRNIATVASS